MTTQFDPTPGINPGPYGPHTRAVPITPADNVDLPMMARRIWVGNAGNIALLPRDNTFNPAVPGGPGNTQGAVVVFENVPVGFFDMWARQVWATGTTATNLVAVA